MFRRGERSDDDDDDDEDDEDDDDEEEDDDADDGALSHLLASPMAKTLSDLGMSHLWTKCDIPQAPSSPN
jgi:TATA-binding protein-associated factor Taf7